MLAFGMFFTSGRAAITRLRAKRTELTGKIGTPAHEGHTKVAQIRAVEAGADTGGHCCIVNAGSCAFLAFYQAGQAGFDTHFAHFFRHGFFSRLKVKVGGHEDCSALPQDHFLHNGRNI